MGGLSCHMRRQKSTRVPGSGPIIIKGKNITPTLYNQLQNGLQIILIVASSSNKCVSS